MVYIQYAVCTLSHILIFPIGSDRKNLHTHLYYTSFDRKLKITYKKALLSR